MNIKQRIIKLCDSMIAFWNQLKIEVEAIPDADDVDIIYKWRTYFPEHGDIIAELGETKRCAKEVEEKLIMERKLKYEVDYGDEK